MGALEQTAACLCSPAWEGLPLPLPFSQPAALGAGQEAASLALSLGKGRAVSESCSWSSSGSLHHWKSSSLLEKLTKHKHTFCALSEELCVPPLLLDITAMHTLRQLRALQSPLPLPCAAGSLRPEEPIMTLKACMGHLLVGAGYA